MVTKRIITAELIHKTDITGIKNAIKQRAARSGISWEGGSIEVSDDSPIPAIVNHGRWIVKCPYCRGAELLNEEHLFMCQSCFNAPASYKFLKVKVPRWGSSIEAILLKRPMMENRNWTNEEASELEEENKAHGLEA